MNKQETERVRKRIFELLDSQKTAVLATQGPSGPYANIVAFVADPELKHLHFATPRSTRKFDNISSQNRVALLVDNSRNQENDFHRAMAVTVTGSARELKESERKRAAGRYLAQHPYLENFIRSKTCALMQVDVEVYYLVENFQQVTELHLQP
jgi:nitroimidazol reductase NimA-like FMN-containing flavoprotein (pyridoxamine 5'-phosphate oxidase superfamily)